MTDIPQVITLAGPTASGKSRIACALAQKIGGVLVNVDALQVYRPFRILTARPSPEEMAAAPHYLYGYVDADQAYSVSHWYEDARCLWQKWVASHGTPRPVIFVGGTGLYFKALCEGLSPIPQIDPEIRAYWRSYAERFPQQLFRRLQEKDALLAQKLAPNDRQRLVRGLEVIESTGISLLEWQKQPGTPFLPPDQIGARFVLAPRRDWLYERINLRFAQMIAAGGLDEVDAARKKIIDPSAPVAKAIGYHPLLKYLDGLCTQEEALEEGQKQSRRYAKRQMTWFRHHCSSWQQLAPEERSLDELVVKMMPPGH